MKLFSLSSKTLQVIALTAVLTTLAPLASASPLGAPASPSSSSSKKSPKKATPRSVACSPAIKPVVGTWFVNQDGREDHDKRLVLRPNGTFAFIGTGWKSEGNFSFKDNAIILNWTRVDGSPVKPGQMHKELAMEPGGGFHIDTYQYYKHLDDNQAKAAPKQQAAEAITRKAS